MILYITYRYGSGRQTTTDHVRLNGRTKEEALRQWEEDNPRKAIWVESISVKERFPSMDISLVGGRRNDINTNEYNPS